MSKTKFRLHARARGFLCVLALYLLAFPAGSILRAAAESEPNDDRKTANELKPGETITGYFNPGRDIDIYHIAVTGEPLDLLFVELSGIEDVDSYIILLDAKGEELSNIDINEDGEGEALAMLKVPPGDYYLKLESDDPDAKNPYALTVAGPELNEPEPEEIAEALEKALDYLAGEQVTGGFWRDEYEESTGIAGLCLMAFVGSESLLEKYDPNIRSTIDFITSKYRPSADYEEGSEERAREGGLIYHHAGGYAPPYEHSIAVLALVETLAVLKEWSLKPMITDGLEAIARWQNTEHKPKVLNGPVARGSEAYGGWRYHPWTTDSDISATGWMILALKAGVNARFEIPEWALPAAAEFVRSCYDKELSSFLYMSEERYKSCVATSAGVLSLQMCGYPEDPLVAPAIRFMQDHPPVWEFEEPSYWGGWPFYYWYYAHRAMWSQGGDDWRVWKAWISRILVEHQDADGSWKPGQRESTAGRVYTTALGALMLEICAGHVPIYLLTEEELTDLEEEKPKKPGFVQVAFEKGAGTKTAKNVELILDASNSMWGEIGGEHKITIAREVLDEVIRKLPAGIHVGLRVFGHRYRPSEERANTDSELLFPIGPVDKARLIQTVNKITPKGKTPLVYSILEAPNDFKAIGQGTIIVVTDGIETCGGDIRSIAPILEKSGLDLKVNIVGFDIEGAEAREELASIAKSTGGLYLDAKNPEELLASLEETLMVEFVLRDEEGKEAARGTVGGKPVEVLEGTYTMRLMLEPDPLETPVVVAPEKRTMLFLGRDGDEWTVRKGN